MERGARERASFTVTMEMLCYTMLHLLSKHLAMIRPSRGSAILPDQLEPIPMGKRVMNHESQIISPLINLLSHTISISIPFNRPASSR